MPQVYRTLVIAALLICGCVAELSLHAGQAAVGASENIRLLPESPKQGETLVVLVSLPGDVTPPAVAFNKKTYKLYPAGGLEKAPITYRALVGVPADLPVGSYPLSIGVSQRNIAVQSGGFGVQKIRLPKEKDNFMASPGEEEAVNSAKATATARQLWDNKFQPPSKARTSTRFGLRRMVNGRLLQDYFHSGLDYAGALGSPVCATQRGRVILAHNGWRLHGNCIALDHGQGVISFYIHLSKILVKSGQVVEPGQEIGKVGATGRASGPHLHFSLYVNGDATNPLDWFTRTI